MALIDPHSFTDSTHPVTTHISLSLPRLPILHHPRHCSPLSLSNPHNDPLSLDTCSLTIHSVLNPQSQAPIPNLLSLLRRRSPLPSIFFLSSSTSPACPAIDRSAPLSLLSYFLCRGCGGFLFVLLGVVGLLLADLVWLGLYLCSCCG